MTDSVDVQRFDALERQGSIVVRGTYSSQGARRPQVPPVGDNGPVGNNSVWPSNYQQQQPSIELMVGQNADGTGLVMVDWDGNAISHPGVMLNDPEDEVVDPEQQKVDKFKTDLLCDACCRSIKLIIFTVIFLLDRSVAGVPDHDIHVWGQMNLIVLTMEVVFRCCCR